MRNRLLLILVMLAHGKAAGWTFEAVYTADYLRNLDGGLREDAAYLQNVDLMFESPVRALFGDADATIFAYLLYNDGSTFSDPILGDAQVVSNIDAGRALRVFELWYEQPFGRFGAKFGLFDLNSEFDAIDSAGLFLNSSHGIGAEFAQSGRNGPSIFPVTSLALRVNRTFGGLGTLRYVVLDGVPGDPDDFDRTTIDLGGGDGVLQTVELDLSVHPRVRIGAGYWRYSGEFDAIGRSEPGEDPVRDDGNDGWYALGEGKLIESADGTSVSGFLRYGRADEAFNDFKSYLGAGLVVDTPFGPAGTRFGLAVASVATGDARRRLNPELEHRETILELTARFPLTPWLTVQPDLQYVVNPGVDPSLENAWVFGLRIEIGKRWEANP